MAKKALVIVLSIISLLFVSAAVITSITERGYAVEAATVYKQGSTGEVVKKIQTALQKEGLYSGKIDGIYGSMTTAAVKAYQKRKGLAQDGIVGSKTAAALGISLTGSATSGGYSASDILILARCVYAEARGEPYTGQVAIAAVVLNRVKNPNFPNTIAGVIYQPRAFTAVDDGQINLTPNDTAKKAAQDALNGWDPTNGCIYYFNPKTATSAWIWSRKHILTIGNHRFCV